MPNSNPPSTGSTRTFFVIFACFVLSGAAGLVYEVLWVRMLSLVFGATTLAISAVLCAFMAGLALGSFVAGKKAGRLSRPVFAYGVIEIIIGLYALIVPVLFQLIEFAYVAIWQRFHPSFYVFALCRFALAGIILFVPTTLMGATLPVLAQAARSSRLKSANPVPRLYAGNLAGAIIGTLVAGFFLLPSLGIRKTIWMAAAINLLIGCLSLVIDRRHQLAPATHQLEEQDVLPSGIKPIGFWLLCAFASGFVSIGMQLVWSRLLAMIIGSSTYAFSIVLALFLGGLATGAYVISQTSLREPAVLRRTLFWLEILTAVSLFASIPATNATPAMLIRYGFVLGINTWTGLLAMQTAAAAIVIYIPAVLMGMILPIVLLRAQGRGNGKVLLAGASIRFIGHSYALNTLGAIFGSLITAFVLLAGFGSRLTVWVMASACVVVATVAYEPRQANADRALRRSLAVGAGVISILIMLALWPRLSLDRLSIGAYDSFVRVLARSRGDVPSNDTSATQNDHQLLMFEEGRSATVSVRKDWNITSLAINGRTNASDSEDMPTQIMLGQLGVLLAPRLNNTLVVGFATGVTAGAMLQSPVQSLACVEIEPAAVSASRFFEQVNRHPLADKRMHLVIDDARTYLKVNPVIYDLIVSEPSHPWVPGVANLFTREFFALGSARLQNDGVFVQWLQTYQLSTESLRSVLATFQQVFPHVLIFRVEGAAKGKDLILLGSRSPLKLDRLNQPLDAQSSQELGRAGIKTSRDLIDSWFVCDESRLGEALRGAQINSDDNMLIEMRAPAGAFRPTLEENGAWIENLKSKSPAN